MLSVFCWLQLDAWVCLTNLIAQTHLTDLYTPSKRARVILVQHAYNVQHTCNVYHTTYDRLARAPPRLFNRAGERCSMQRAQRAEALRRRASKAGCRQADSQPRTDSAYAVYRLQRALQVVQRWRAHDILLQRELPHVRNRCNTQPALCRSV